MAGLEMVVEKQALRYGLRPSVEMTHLCIDQDICKEKHKAGGLGSSV